MIPTPKEKAGQLISKYNLIVLDTDLGGTNRKVRRCALMCVDEIMEYTKRHGFVGLTEYYESVKEEIKKL